MVFNATFNNISVIKHFWMNIVTSPEIFKDGSARAGIEALLCYHGYSWTGTFVQSYDYFK
jgi:hypothetical protein